MALMNDVYSYIENNYKPNEPIFLSELNIPGMKAVSVRQQMKKLTESGRLKRFDTGIYYIPKKSMFRSGSSLSALILNPGIILADEPTGALDSRNAKALMEKLLGLNRDDNTTILMVTHDSNAASFCKRILFIQDGRIFHELRRDMERESQQEFYERILKLMAQMGGGSANVL